MNKPEENREENLEAQEEYNKALEKRVRKGYNRLTKYLIKKGFTITTMESITSGQIASLITDTEGSSAILKGAFVTYCNEAKVRQGVPKEIIDKYSVYSTETAAAMAHAAKAAYGADIGIGVTGTASNTDPENPDASVPGALYFAIEIEGRSEAFEKQLPCQTERYLFKFSAAEAVLNELWELI
jgi:PncC family amidohydrolase